MRPDLSYSGLSAAALAMAQGNSGAEPLAPQQVSSPTFLKKSFASILGSSTPCQPILHEKKSTLLRGEPAVLLNDEELQKLCSPLKFALIGSFTNSRPPMKEIKQFFFARGFKGAVDVILLNQRKILIRPVLEEDYIRIWEKKIWSINSTYMRVVKWSPHAHLLHESPIAPV